MKPETIKIDEVEYVRKDSAAQMAAEVDGKPFVIVRSYGAGVFAGYLRSRTAEASGVSVVLDRCIRLWRWTGCSLSQVAIDGVAGSGENKFSVPTDCHEICQAIEVIPATEKARMAIQGVKPWKL